MNVYEVDARLNDFRRLKFDQSKISSELMLKAMDDLACAGVPKEEWAVPKLHLGGPLKPEPDFWGIPIPGGSFAVHPRVLDVVSMFYEIAGQTLPVHFKNLEFTLLNILEVYDCADEERSLWYTDRGEKFRVRRPFFVPQHLERSTLFKIPTRESTIYCWEDNRDPEDEFKACVEENHLQGLRFDLVWTDEDGEPRITGGSS